MGRAVLERLLHGAARQQPVDQPRCERVAAAHTIQDFEVGPRCRHVERAVGVGRGAPVVASSRLRVAQCRGNQAEIRVFANDVDHHPAEVRRIERREVRVQPFDLEAECRAEVLLVAEHHVDER